MARASAWTFPRTSEPAWDLTVVRLEADAVAAWSFADESDAALVSACLNGRTAAFDLLVERHRRAVYQLCYRFVSNHEDASDLTQDVFLRAYRGLRNFRGHSSLGTWLHRIAVNVCLNRVSVRTPQSEPIEEDQVLDVRQQARFRVFEETMEQRKVELLMRARQANRPLNRPLNRQPEPQ